MFIAGATKTAALVETGAAARAAAYLELTKPRVAALVLAVAVAGFWLGSAGTPDAARLWGTIAGVALLAGGIFTLNQYYERDLDGLMRRTGGRPLPAGRLYPAEALWFGWALCAAALACLALAVNALSAAVGAATLASYLFLYTPLKKRTPHCTLIGAFPGAAPPLLGWAAARGQLGPEAWALFSILFFWQFPHFHAIALLYREDYGRAGIRMWPVVEPECRTLAREIVLFTGLLVPASLLPAWLGLAGPLYSVGAALLGVPFLVLGIRAASVKTKLYAQRLLLASVLYLPALLALMVWGR